MMASLLCSTLSFVGSAFAARAPVRVDLFAHSPGTWLVDELVLAPFRPGFAAVRWLEQVQPVWQTGWGRGETGWEVGVSLASQTLVRRRPLHLHPILPDSWAVGLQTNTLLPQGLVGEGAWEWRGVGLGVGLSVLSASSWVHRSWDEWRVLPTLRLSWVLGSQSDKRVE